MFLHMHKSKCISCYISHQHNHEVVVLQPVFRSKPIIRESPDAFCVSRFADMVHVCTEQAQFFPRSNGFTKDPVVRHSAGFDPPTRLRVKWSCTNMKSLYQPVNKFWGRVWIFNGVKLALDQLRCSTRSSGGLSSY